MTNMKDSVRCTNCKSCIAGQQRSVRASAKNSGKTWKDCGRAASKTSSKSNFGEGCSAEISEVRNVRKGRARLCKASKAGIRRWDESLAKQVKGDLGRWQTYANSMQCGKKTFQISWYVTIYQHATPRLSSNVSIHYWNVRRILKSEAVSQLQAGPILQGPLVFPWFGVAVEL